VPLESAHTPQEALLALRGDRHPFALIGAWAGGGAIVGSEPVETAPADADPFALLDRRPSVLGEAPGGAVGGGWFGYLGYGLGARVERLPPQPPRPVPLAPFWLAFYDHVLHLDAHGQWWFEALGTTPAIDRRLALLRERLTQPPPRPRPVRCDPFVPRPGRGAHARAVDWCRRWIEAGDLYQANLCIRLDSAIDGAGIDLFARASAELAPPYAAYVSGGGAELASLSPELFLRRRGREVVTRPIKGTARRDPAGARGRDELAASAKDRAENMMIVDLMRNDLGRTCTTGSVRVVEVAEPEAHPGVWHLVSEVRGTLPDGAGDGDLVAAAFPPGSVTGAPKIKAMEVIATLESTGREAYTGAIGFASPLAGLELNVAIRTFEVAGERIWIGAGGGIVADSDPDAEWRECLDKVRPLIQAAGAELDDGARVRGEPAAAEPLRLPRPDPALGIFETLLVTEGVPVDLDAHLGRLRRSAAQVYGLDLDDDLAARVTAAGAACPVQSLMRIRMTAGGHLEIDTGPASTRPSAPAQLTPIVLPGGLGEHKWSDRRLVDSVPGEALILDLTGEVLEAGAGAIVAVEGDRMVSPPADGRILPSVTLAGMQDVAREPLTFERLKAADDMLVVSSIRRIQRATVVAQGP
jgi:para-aminobenzoate synthetase/4-amino-4-deoxychorismate lyase